MKRPARQGLYDPQFEHESCGVGFVANIKGVKSHSIVQQGLQILVNLEHRGACGFEENTGDGAGILIQMPDKFLRAVTKDEHIDLPPAGIRRAPERVHEAALRCLALAEPYYASGLAGLAYLPPESCRGILIAAKVYREIGEELRRQGPHRTQDRVIVPATRKALLVVQAFVQRSPWTTPVPPHDANLHRHLDNLVGIHL